MEYNENRNMKYNEKDNKIKLMLGSVSMCLGVDQGMWCWWWVNAGGGGTRC